MNKSTKGSGEYMIKEESKKRLEVTEDGKVLTSRAINIRKGFLQVDSYSPVGFCLTEVLVSLFIHLFLLFSSEKSFSKSYLQKYRMEQREEERVKSTHSLFIDNLKIYQESYQNLKVVNEMIVKASMDIGACYGVRKCAEIVFRKVKLIKGGLMFWGKNGHV